jgi:hypothetical protein
MMFRTASATVLALGFLALGALAVPAHAMDCQKEFRVRVDRMMAKRDIRVPTLDMINTTRFLLQGYDACMSGDMVSAKSYFEKMRRQGK